MGDPIEIHRREVAERIQVAMSQGGWEGTDTDFKKELGSTPKNFAKTLKHILAFANTPRRWSAYIIFGVEEDESQPRIFKHVGIPAGGFPSPERIEQLVRDYTEPVVDITVDAYYELNGKCTPYIVIPLQEEGPYVLARAVKQAVQTVDSKVVFRRYGGQSMQATERDVRRMREDWTAWFLDCRYEKTSRSLRQLLANRFPRHEVIEDKRDYVRMVYESTIQDEFGSHQARGLIHAYWGFDSLGPRTVEMIADDDQHVAHKRIIGTRFAQATKQAAAEASVLCISLDDIYYVNDPYANLCRAFLARWQRTLSENLRGAVIDLDYRLSLTSGSDYLRSSIISFVEDQLKPTERKAIVVHGGFGCGKTTTASQVTAYLCQDYLRGNSSVPKVLYVDVNNIDIRSRRDECIESQLLRYRLDREHIDKLVNQVREDDIQLIFDGIDEMAKPHTSAGRREAIELLQDVGNRRPAAYFVRTSYYPELEAMIADFGLVADADLSSMKKLVVAAQIQGLRQEQVEEYLSQRLGSEAMREVRSGLHRIGLASFLGDPLIISFVTNLVEQEGTEAISSFPRRNQKAHFLSYLVDRLLEREQRKRSRHKGLARDFTLFKEVLRSVAFKMVCLRSSAILPRQLERFIDQALENRESRNENAGASREEVINEFRTMAWIERSDDGDLSFRHDALTTVCAAEHVCEQFRYVNPSGIQEWDNEAPLADVVCEYASEIAGGDALLHATSLLRPSVQVSVRLLAEKVLEAAQQTRGLEDVKVADQLDDRTIAAICDGAASAPHVGRLPVRILIHSLGVKRALQVEVALLWKLAHSEAPHAVELALDILHFMSDRKRSFREVLQAIRSDQTAKIDHVLLKYLDIPSGLMLDSLSYEMLFKRIYALSDAPEMREIAKDLTQYADRTLKSIEGDKARRHHTS